MIHESRKINITLCLKFAIFCFLLTLSFWTHGVNTSEEEEAKCKCKPNALCDSTALKWTAGIATGVVAAASVPVVLGAAGFTAGGIAAGSIAATIQGAAYGGATAGAFAALQSVGAAGLGVVSGGLLKVGTTLGVTTAIDNLCKCECEES